MKKQTAVRKNELPGDESLFETLKQWFLIRRITAAYTHCTINLQEKTKQKYDGLLKNRYKARKDDHIADARVWRQSGYAAPESAEDAASEEETEPDEPEDAASAAGS